MAPLEGQVFVPGLAANMILARPDSTRYVQSKHQTVFGEEVFGGRNGGLWRGLIERGEISSMTFFSFYRKIMIPPSHRQHTLDAFIISFPVHTFSQRHFFLLSDTSFLRFLL